MTKTLADSLAEESGVEARNLTAKGSALLIALRKQQQTRLWLSVFAGVNATVLLVIIWFLAAWLIDQLIIKNTITADRKLVISILGITLLWLLRSQLLYWQERLAQDASSRIKKTLRQKMLLAWQVVGISQLQRSPSVYASHLLEDVDALDGYYARYWPQQQLLLLSPLCILLAISWTDWLVGLLLLFSAPLIPLFMSLIGMGAEQINQRHLLQRQRLAGHFLDRLKKIALIARLGAAAQVQDEVAARSQSYRRLIMQTLKVAFLSSAVLEFFSSVAIAAVAIYIGFALFGAIDFGPAPQLTLSTGLFILALAPEFFQPIRQFAQSYHDKASALAAATEISNIINITTEVPTPSATAMVGALDVTNLTIKNPSGQSLATNLDFYVEPQQCLLISGPSGVGKTTLLKTLAGLIPVAAGKVQFNQVSPSQVCIYYMAQRPWVVNGSIRQNLQLLSGPVNDAALLNALNNVGLAKLCPTVSALDQLISERGEGLSGGQLQRIALARAFLIPYGLMLLDEPTSCLDLESRRYVIQALHTLKLTCTLVIVSHDSELQALADQHLELLEVTDAIS
ncbi:thiol reductant ABC exporter subunit CydD [Alishewanella sp. SMS8]|uniref:thiol reductant ABC exporter subunit CydD n=1 Tax=Alishewanella sp. SMS8 TaxID=2994676 RepID=UPI0027424F6B|nr:thiol reductant ABC exporter subunit CydD [Alishewanella sp. SMS8]MDP5459788.1 thiol reductant ABC exporter subunit CydD [Alishewanella sp. SMS8]